MATKSELAQQERERESAIRESIEMIINHADDDRGTAVGTLEALGEAIERERAHLAVAKRKGWQSAIKARITAKEIVKAWRDRLIEYAPAAGPTPEPAEITPRSAVPDLEQRLVDAFGPDLATLRHIRTVVERNDDPQDGSITYGNLCDGKVGTWTSPENANCPDCRAAHGEPEMSNGVDAPARRDEPITPTVAREIREEIDAEKAWPGPGLVTVSDGVDASAVQRIMELPDHGAVTAGVFNAAPPGETVVGTLNDHSTGESWPMTGHAVGDTVTVGGIEFTKISDNPFGDRVVPEFHDPPAVLPDHQRLTLHEISTRGLARRRGIDHRSYSQVSAFEECGARYALDDGNTPAWWNVGGTTFHNMAMKINRMTLAKPLIDMTDEMISVLWQTEFEQEILRVGNETGSTDTSTWRAANKGTEHYDWWRVEGPPMVRRYLDWLNRMLADGWRVAADQNSLPMIEFPVSFWVHTSDPTQHAAGVKVDNVIDLVLVRDGGMTQPVPEYLIIDFKSGQKAPTSNLQLAFYVWALASLGIDPHAVRSAYYLARRGETTAPADVTQAFPWPDIATRIVAMDQQERAGLYIPRPSVFCGSCPVNRLCPEGPRR
jgi:hypothetical protein